MTPAVLAHKIWTTRRGVGLLISAMMLAVLALTYAILVNADHRQVVSYGSVVYAPTPASVCPGDSITYPVEVTVTADDLPALSRVVEAWRRDADGVTLQTTARVYELPLVRPVTVRTTARRTAPNLPAGVYWLDHVSQNGKTTGYTVGPVTILDCADAD